MSAKEPATTPFSELVPKLRSGYYGSHRDVVLIFVESRPADDFESRLPDAVPAIGLA